MQTINGLTASLALILTLLPYVAFFVVLIPMCIAWSNHYTVKGEEKLVDVWARISSAGVVTSTTVVFDLKVLNEYGLHAVLQNCSILWRYGSNLPQQLSIVWFICVFVTPFVSIATLVHLFRVNLPLQEAEIDNPYRPGY